MRIDKFLSNMGEGSRQQIKKLIKSGAVCVDGQIIYKSDTQINPSQNIYINGKQIVYRKYIYIMMNKPQNVISATQDTKDKTVIDILDDGYKTLPADLKIIKSSNISSIELTIFEGKFHQVKRMFESVNKKVIFLKRIAIGNLKLDKNLDIGKYRYLTESELNLLK